MSRIANTLIFRSGAIRSPCLLCLLMLFLVGPALATQSILVIYDAESAAHRTILNSLRNSGAVNNAGGSRSEIRELTVAELGANGILDNSAGLIITVGARAAVHLSQHPIDIPVLNVFLPRATYEQLQAEAAANTAAIVLDQPIERELALARVLLPDARRVGTLVGSGNGSDPVVMQQAASRFGLDLDVVRIEPGEHPVDAIEAVLQGNDLIIATFDPEAYKPATAKWLLYLAFQQRRPIIGFSYALLKAGAVGVVFSTPEQIAQHAVELVNGWLATGRPPAGEAFPRYYHIGVNAPVADKLGLKPPSSEELERQVHELLSNTQ